MIRLAIRVASFLLTILVVYLTVTFVQVWQASRRDSRPQAEAIVVFGAAQYNGRPSPVLRARLDHAKDLYDEGIAEVIVVTGGRGEGDRFSEASVGADYLIRRGVNDDAILREVSGRNSWQSLASAANELKKRGRTRVVLVSDPFHAARIAAMADELGLDASVSPTDSSPIGGAEEMQHLVRETVAMAAGRVVGFRRLMGIERTATRVREEVRGE